MSQSGRDLPLVHSGKVRDLYDAGDGLHCARRVDEPGLVGGDDDGAALVELLRTLGVDTQALVVTPGRPTTSKTRIVARGQQIVRMDHETTLPIDAEAEDKLIATVEREMPRAAACILSDYAKAVVSERVAQAAIASARRAGCVVVVDPKARSLARVRRRSDLSQPSAPD